MKTVKTIILCGGQGTRLREETEYRPKPLVDIGGFPILWHIMKIYATYGFQDFILCLGYRGNMIKDYFLSYEALNNDFTINLGKNNSIQYHGEHTEQNYHVTLADTGIETMTGSRIKQVEHYIDNDIFMATYGDGVSDVNIKSLLDFHIRHGKLATITTVRRTSRFGLITIDDNGLVKSFAEKPKLYDWSNAGFFVFNHGVFDYLDADPACILERDPLESLSADGQLVAYKHDGFFFAMDTYREYLFLNDLWKQGKAPWACWGDQS